MRANAMKALVLLMSILSGCAMLSQSAPVGTGHFIACHMDMTQCFREANRLCPYGYEIIHLDEVRDPYATSILYYSVQGTSVYGKLLIDCGE
jgi:hypothetical protein